MRGSIWIVDHMRGDISGPLTKLLIRELEATVGVFHIQGITLPEVLAKRAQNSLGHLAAVFIDFHPTRETLDMCLQFAKHHRDTEVFYVDNREDRASEAEIYHTTEEATKARREKPIRIINSQNAVDIYLRVYYALVTRPAAAAQQ